jgi:hypothetical protein
VSKQALHRRADYLAHIVEAIDAIADYTAGMELEQFLADRKTCDAVIRNIEIILEKAVGCARVCRARRVQQGVTTQWAPAHKEEQRSWARWARCNRVHSVITQEVSSQKGKKVCIHAGSQAFTSGQLLFLGSSAKPATAYSNTMLISRKHRQEFRGDLPMKCATRFRMAISPWTKRLFGKPFGAICQPCAPRSPNCSEHRAA